MIKIINKNEKGITLIALVITIIVLLILAGVAISMLSGENGILKKAAKAVGDKNISMISVKELLPLTGYIRGGCSPVGMKKKYPTHIDEMCILFDEIAVSAGARGHQMILPPHALADLVGADIVELT